MHDSSLKSAMQHRIMYMKAPQKELMEFNERFFHKIHKFGSEAVKITFTDPYFGLESDLLCHHTTRYDCFGELEVCLTCQQLQ